MCSPHLLSVSHFVGCRHSLSGTYQPAVTAHEKRHLHVPRSAPQSARTTIWLWNNQHLAQDESLIAFGTKAIDLFAAKSEGPDVTSSNQHIDKSRLRLITRRRSGTRSRLGLAAPRLVPRTIAGFVLLLTFATLGAKLRIRSFEGCNGPERAFYLCQACGCDSTNHFL